MYVCGSQYFGETGRPLVVRVFERIQLAKMNASILAAHAWAKEYMIMLDAVPIVRESKGSAGFKIFEALGQVL